MTSINVHMSELSSHRFGRLQERLGTTRQDALGLLILFWAESRRLGLESGDFAAIAACVPGANPGEGAAALLNAGYVRALDNEAYAVVDNAGVVDRKARRQEIMRKATAASVAKRSQKAKRQPVAKTAALVAHKPQGVGTPTWNAYADAYEEKFGKRPPHSAKTASQCKMFAERMPQEDAPSVIRFYLQHPERRYIARMYSLDLALSDAVALHTQWASGRVITESTASQVSSALSYQSERDLIQAGLL